MAIAVLLSVGATKKDALQEQHITLVLSLLESAEPHFPDVSEFLFGNGSVLCSRWSLPTFFYTSCDNSSSGDGCKVNVFPLLVLSPPCTIQIGESLH